MEPYRQARQRLDQTVRTHTQTPGDDNLPIITTGTLLDLKSLGIILTPDANGVVEWNGIRTRVAKDAEAYQDGVVVCSDWDNPSMFMNDVTCRCAGCNQKLRVRPHVPKNLTRLCVRCSAVRIETDAQEAKDASAG